MPSFTNFDLHYFTLNTGHGFVTVLQNCPLYGRYNTALKKYEGVCVAKEKQFVGSLIELNAQSTDEKIKISPIGLVTGVDGRVYQVNGDDVVERIKAQKIDIVLNVNHAMDSHGEKAAGWFDVNSLEVREDGIYAALEPTDIGSTLITEKHFRYLSPEYHISWNGDIREVHDIGAVGLVNRPNVLDEALNNAENPEEDTLPKEVEPTDAEKALQTQLAKEKEINAQHMADAKKAKIETAVAAGELMPNKQAFAMGLDGEVLTNFLALEKNDAKHLGGDVKPDAKDEESQVSDEEAEVNRQLGLGDNDDN
jgi:phage I-like protein